MSLFRSWAVRHVLARYASRFSEGGSRRRVWIRLLILGAFLVSLDQASLGQAKEPITGAWTYLIEQRGGSPTFNASISLPPNVLENQTITYSITSYEIDSHTFIQFNQTDETGHKLATTSLRIDEDGYNTQVQSIVSDGFEYIYVTVVDISTETNQPTRFRIFEFSAYNGTYLSTVTNGSAEFPENLLAVGAKGDATILTASQQGTALVPGPFTVRDYQGTSLLNTSTDSSVNVYQAVISNNAYLAAAATDLEDSSGNSTCIVCYDSNLKQLRRDTKTNSSSNGVSTNWTPYVSIGPGDQVVELWSEATFNSNNNANNFDYEADALQLDGQPVLEWRNAGQGEILNGCPDVEPNSGTEFGAFLNLSDPHNPSSPNTSIVYIASDGKVGFDFKAALVPLVFAYDASFGGCFVLSEDSNANYFMQKYSTTGIGSDLYKILVGGGTDVQVNGLACQSGLIDAYGLATVAGAVTPFLNCYVEGIALNNLSATAKVAGGKSGQVTLTLNEKTTSSFAVSLASSSKDVTLPSSAAVPAGQSQVSVPFTTSGVNAAEAVTITGVAGAVQRSAVITIDPAGLASVTGVPSTATGGNSLAGKINLDGIAGPSGVKISMRSDDVALIPNQSFEVAAGATAQTITIKSNVAKTTTNLTLTFADPSGNKKTVVVAVYPPPVSSISLSPTLVIGGAPSTGTVTIASAAPTGGAPVRLSSSSTSAHVPASVTIAGGKTSATFTVTTNAVPSDTKATISATDGQASKTAGLTVKAPVLTSLSLNPTSVVGGSSSAGTVALSGPAPTGGVTVTLSSGSASANVPQSVTIKAGETSTTFTVKTSKVSSKTSATITAKSGSVSKSATLTITS